jgi:NADH-quinone oxidoreductase subunit A
MSAIDSSVNIVAYLALFSGVGIIFLFVNLLVGRFLRPSDPHPEKLEIYECGEPTIGSSFVQFDLRFYVVALLFIIFDVEVAFFFPWAATFGKATNAMRSEFAAVDRVNGDLKLTQPAVDLYREMGVRQPTVPTEVPATLAASVTSTDPIDRANDVVHQGMQQLAWVTIVDIGAFFAILMIGFAYVWKRGDLDWVRAVSREQGQTGVRTPLADPLDEAQYISA